MKKNKFLTAFVVLVYIFLFAPLAIIAMTSIGTENYIAFPPKGFSLQWFATVFKSEAFVSSMVTSLVISGVATLVALIIGMPAAYGLSRYDFKGKGAIKSFFFSPLIIPGIVVGFSLFQFLLVRLNLSVYMSLFIGHTLVIIPYIIRVIGSSLEVFDYSIEEAAMSLGCKKSKTFFKVVLPNITSGVMAAFMLAFINSFNNVPVSMFLTGPGVSTLPITMMNYVEYNYDPTVSALSVILMILTVGIMYILEKTLGLNNFAA
ncbi:ABC transporter permease [Romboutsia weinsteinii]|uniref:ABC transporter permease n=1 Tax=Romboutsia weinsteinii TaxID=2020949 RepID=A0A371J0S0_9FIRM|nr:ABC transporter permease [Romboutsia weinsteinii]RDY26369.1 ABC transporter permease [Romboutsia weinsteinii]